MLLSVLLISVPVEVLVIIHLIRVTILFFVCLFHFCFKHISSPYPPVELFEILHDKFYVCRLINIS